MAYGKIKADTLVYDNSGSDTEVTIASLGSKANLPASAGTVGTSEVVQVDANKDITGFRNITLSGDLTVNGTTTTIDSTTLTVEDKNIELGKVSSPSDTTADGGGITLKGATDKTFNWVDATDAWTSSEHINLGDNKELKLGTDSDFKIYHNGSHNVIAGRHASADLYIQTNDDTIFEKVDSSGANAEVLAKFISDGGCELYHDNSKKIETTANGVTVSGSVTDDKGNVRSIPAKDQGGASEYTLIASDAGKTVLRYGGGLTIPASIMSTGDAVTIINASGSDITLTQGSGFTLYNTADASTGNRTLAGRGMATIWFPGASSGYISGAGLS